MEKTKLLFEMIDDLKKEVESIRKFEDEKTCVFIRSDIANQRGEVRFSTWKVLLDESKSMICTRDGQGFKTNVKAFGDQRVSSPEGTKDLLLSKNISDKEIARTILDQLAEEKYAN